MFGNYNQIIENRLWVGARLHPQDAKRLQRIGITVVVNLQTDQELKQSRISLKKLLAALTEADIALRRVQVEDFNKAQLAEKLSACVAEVEAALAPGWARAYVHCNVGVNRSPTVAAAYLIKSQGMTAQAAYNYLVDKRYCSPSLDLLEEFYRITNAK